MYVPNTLALQIDSKGANIVITKSADKTFADVGEEITYTIVLKNTGAVDALNVTVSDLLPPETTLVPNSVAVDGVPYAGALPVVISSISAGQSATVTFKAVANSIPAVNPVFNIARADYEFFPFAGYPATGFSNSKFKDEIPAGTTFVNGSVYIDGVNFPAYNPQTGFFAANLTPQASVTVTFQVQVN